MPVSLSMIKFSPPPGEVGNRTAPDRLRLPVVRYDIAGKSEALLLTYGSPPNLSELAGS